MTKEDREAERMEGAASRVLVLDVPIVDPRELRSTASRALAEIETFERLGYQARKLRLSGYLVRSRL